MLSNYKIFSEKPNFNFLKFKKIAFIFSFILILTSVFSLISNGLNFGIDFKGGLLIEMRNKSMKPVDISKFRENARSLIPGEISIQKFGKETDILLRVQKQDGNQKDQIKLVNKIKDNYSDKFEIRRT